MTLRPLADQIIIKQDLSAGQSPGGIILPTQSELAQGVVLAVGPNVDSVRVGERVAYSPHGGEKFKFEGDEMTVIEDQDLFGVLEA